VASTELIKKPKLSLRFIFDEITYQLFKTIVNATVCRGRY